uniref:Putative mitogen-activated protein (MAP) kinase kinase kinase, MLK1/MLK2/MLK4 n=1 Tax=Helianthus annuus TaxID=4232 RepID=A0A251TPC1_HELAN
MLSKVQHKNLVNFIGACKDPVMVIVTELLTGGTLRKYLVNMRPNGLDTHVPIGFALDIARAMDFAIVLWELIHKLPFEGMSNQQAAYAAAFKVFFLSKNGQVRHVQ